MYYTNIEQYFIAIYGVIKTIGIKEKNRYLVDAESCNCVVLLVDNFHRLLHESELLVRPLMFPMVTAKGHGNSNQLVEVKKNLNYPSVTDSPSATLSLLTKDCDSEMVAGAAAVTTAARCSLPRPPPKMHLTNTFCTGRLRTRYCQRRRAAATP